MNKLTLYTSITFLALLATLANCDTNTYTQGKAIYEYKCANCHQINGEGLVGNIPPLAQADWLSENREQIACVIRYGMQGEIVVNELSYSGIMAGYPELSETELTNLINYMLTAWGNDYPTVSPVEIAVHLKACEDQELIREANPQQLKQAN